MNRNYSLIVFVLLMKFIMFIQSSLFAQSNVNIKMVMDMPTGPEVASFMKYVDNPVNYSTGTPNITIPLYTLSEGTLSEQVSLTYHSGGFKVNEVASWVGLGWHLNAGGMITRQVKGGPDEGRNSTAGLSDLKGWGWLKNGGVPQEIIDIVNANAENNNQASNCQGGTCCTPNCIPVKRMYDVANGYIDTEPDIYTYNFGSFSGKFFFDENGIPFSIPKNDLQITHTRVSAPNAITEWKVVTPDGTQYFFGEGNAIEYSTYDPLGGNGFGSAFENNRTTSWMLTRVVSFNGEDILSFEYQDVDYSYVDVPPHTYNFDGTSGSLFNVPGHFGKTTVEGKRLSEITTNKSGYSLDFKVGTIPREDLVTSTAKPLNEVVLKYNTTEVKKFELTTSYFEENTPHIFGGMNQDALKRLRLDEVQEMAGTETIPKYDFEYIEEVDISGVMTGIIPSRLSLGRDHWGYYNGQNDNTGLLPNDMNGCGNLDKDGGANKSPSSDHMRFAILKKIIFPTGGSKVYEYEPHTHGSLTIGGLRIASITNNYSIGPSVVTNYTYGVSNLYVPAGPNDYVQSFSFGQSGPTGGNICVASSSLYSLAGPSANHHINYRHVEEFQPGNGKTVVYTYHTIPMSDGQFPRRPRRNDLDHGKLQFLKYFKQSDLANFIYSKEDDYPGNFTDQKTVTAMTVGSLTCNDGPGCINLPANSGTIYYRGGAYDVITASHQLSEVTEILDGVSTVTKYAYDFAHQQAPISESIVNSDGKEHIAKYYYANDYKNEEVTAIGQYFIDNNKKLPAWKVENYVAPMAGGVQTQVDGQKTTFKEFFSGKYYPEFVYRYEYTWDEMGNPVANPSWEKSHSFLDYNSTIGKPISINVEGWEEDHIYTWTATGKLATWRFGPDPDPFTKSFDYHPSNDLISKITEIDGTSTSFQYDEFLRMSKEEHRDITNAVKRYTDYEYDYTSDSYPFIKTSEHFDEYGLNLQPLDRVTHNYIDGLGRDIQTLRISQAPGNSDHIAISKEYDQYGRIIKDYEPVQIQGLGDQNEPINQEYQAVQSGWHYTEYAYEASPLKRMAASTMPDWNTSKTYHYEAVTEVNDVVYIDPVNPLNPTWGDNSLFKKTVIDENGNKDIVYSDKLGRKLIMRREEGIPTSPMRSDTYYTYDDKNRISAVYPPETVPFISANHDNLVYKYTYYGNDLLATKDLPDQIGIHQFVYDERDLLRFRRDPNLTNAQKWEVAMYDDYGREEISGFYNKNSLAPTDILTPQSAHFDFQQLNTYGQGVAKDKIVEKQFSNRTFPFSYTYDSFGRLESTTEVVDKSGCFTPHYYDTSGGTINVGNYVAGPLVCAGLYLHLEDPQNASNSLTITYDKTHSKFFTYDDADNITEERYNLFGTYPADNYVILNKDYDNAGRLISEGAETDEGEGYELNNGTWTLVQGQQYTSDLSTFSYTVKDQIKQLNLGKDENDNPLEILNYAYLPNGYLDQINDINDPSKTFSLKLDYTNSSLSPTGSLGNGNIYVQAVRFENSAPRQSTYTYDFLDRLTGSNNSYNNSTSYTYHDHRGNFHTIQRHLGNIQIDNLTFDYGDEKSNRVVNITDNPDDYDEPGMGYNILGSGNYSYDKNGNVIYDPSRDATISYDHNNLPTTITTPAGTISYEYTYDGKLLSKTILENGQLTGVRNYFENVEVFNDDVDLIHHSNGYLKRGNFCSNSSTALRLVGEEQQDKEYAAIELTSSRELTTASTIKYTGGNRVTLLNGFRAPNNKNLTLSRAAVNCFELENSFIPHYFLKDHLGNTRVDFKEQADGMGNNVSSDVVGRYAYYPFGGTILDELENSDNKYLYNGKERQEELGLRYYNYGARFYDPTIGRFTGVDPISDEFPHVSTYNYAENEPIANIDLHGLQGIRFGEGVEMTETNKQKGREAFNALIDSAIGFLGSLFREGSAEGNRRNGPSQNTDQGFTVLTKSPKNSAGSIPAPDGEGSTVILEDSDLIFPGGSTIRGAVAKQTPKGIQKFRNIAKGMSKAAKVKEKIEESLGSVPLEQSSKNSPMSKSDTVLIADPSIPASQRDTLDPTSNGKVFIIKKKQ